jgi:hypothetical protein
MVGAHSSVVGSGTVLQTGGPRIRFLISPLDFSFDLIFPTALWPSGSIQPLIEMSSRNPLLRKADNLAACVSQLSRQRGSLNGSQPYKHPQLVKE